ncbi:MAG: extracellular solute-binding protein [Gammaproteobacteria bacterium]|jgi:putrescine transport system substrate-binding protein|nr:extracellular solute-binding protein [Gammaproteobacteria bacterium]
MKKDTAFKSTLVGLTVASLFTVATVATAAGKLNVSNWAEYMAEDTIDNFAKEYDIEVTFTPYDSVEAIDSKLLAGNSGYDVVSHSSSAVARLLNGGILRKIDKTKLSNFKHMSPDVMAQIGKNWDPGHNYIVPYMWGTHGVTFNRELVLETYPNAPIGSEDLIFKPEHMKELAKCGVAFLDSPTDVIPMVLSYMGLDPSSTNADDYKKAEDVLKAVRPYIKTFDNYAYQRMPQKEFCVAVTWGPDGLLAMSGAEEANTGVTLEFFLPKHSQLWVDGWVIPADAKNIENAHLFLNYMMRPEVGANDSNYTWYATANKDAVPMIDEAVTSSSAAFPTAAQVATMYTMKPLPPKKERIRTRTWTNFKANN